MGKDEGIDNGPGKSGRLRIGVDAHAIGERQTGNERFMANLIPALREACDHELFLYFTEAQARDEWAAMPRTQVRLLRPAHPAVRIPFVLPWRAARDDLDVLLVQYSGPPVTTRPVVTVVHDVAFQLFPQFFTPAQRIWMRRTIPFTLRRAAGVISVSKFTKDEIVRVFGVPPERITVAHNGVDPIFADPTARASPLEPPFLLSVGNLQPRKNLSTLIDAFARALELRPDLPERLVIVGKEVQDVETIHRQAEELRRRGRVIFTGYLEDQQLVGLLQHATAFAYPSVYEGFGLPPVEAMAVGVPALVSDIPVMREIVGDAALRLPPRDVEAWAEAILEVTSDEALRSRMIELGRARVELYTWERCARQVLSALEEARRPHGKS
jgi:glycosyltransferase involved in cell wall biosynthesis